MMKKDQRGGKTQWSVAPPPTPPNMQSQRNLGQEDIHQSLTSTDFNWLLRSILCWIEGNISSGNNENSKATRDSPLDPPPRTGHIAGHWTPHRNGWRQFALPTFCSPKCCPHLGVSSPPTPSLQLTMSGDTTVYKWAEIVISTQLVQTV